MTTAAAELATVYAVFADAAEAERIGQAMVGRQLAACVNILPPCQSIYRWQGEIETATEVPALFKTRLRTAPELMDSIRALHSYEIPALMVWPWADCLVDYGQWLRQAVPPGPA